MSAPPEVVGWDFWAHDPGSCSRTSHEYKRQMRHAPRSRGAWHACRSHWQQLREGSAARADRSCSAIVLNPFACVGVAIAW
jgi:hypothetical protein